MNIPHFCTLVDLISLGYMYIYFLNIHYQRDQIMGMQARGRQPQLCLAHAKPSRKIEPVNKAFLFWHWQWPKHIFFWNKTFLFFKIESWNFKNRSEKKFLETSQSFNSFTQLLFSFFLLVVWFSWNFVRFHETLIQTDAESFSFLSWKTKKSFIPKKIRFKP